MEDSIRRLFNVAKGLEETEEEALRLYRTLVYNRFEDFVRTSFPVFSSFVGEELRDILEDFIKEDHASPLLIDLGRDFLDFFHRIRHPVKERLPFLEELLLCEWSEIEVFKAPEEERDGDFSWEGTYRLSASSRLLRFRFPVHRAEELSAEEILKEEGDYCLLIYRDRSHRVNLEELTPFVYSFLKDIDSGRSPIDVLRSSGLSAEEKEEARPYLERFLRELLGLGILVKK